jgi:hypothetical protein
VGPPFPWSVQLFSKYGWCKIIKIWILLDQQSFSFATLQILGASTTALLSKNPLHLKSVRHHVVQIKTCMSCSIWRLGASSRLWKGGQHGLDGGDNAANLMERRARWSHGEDTATWTEQWRRLMRVGRELASMQTGNLRAGFSRWETCSGGSASEQRRLENWAAASSTEGRLGEKLLRNTRAGRFWWGSPQTSGLGAPRAIQNLGRDAGSFGRARILGGFLGYCWSNKFLLDI